MVSELNRQRDLLKWVKNEGGYGYKTTNSTIVGLPDLTLFMDCLPVVTLEVKVVKNQKSKLKITRKQFHIADTFKKAGALHHHFFAVWVDEFKFFCLFRDVEDRADQRIPPHRLTLARTDSPRWVFERLIKDA